MLLALLLFALAGQAQAQEAAPEEAAKAAFMEGRAHYEAERYEEAIEAFERATALSGRAGLLLNVALAQEQLGQTEDALATLARFRREATPEELAATEDRLAELEARLLEGRTVLVSSEAPELKVTELPAAEPERAELEVAELEVAEPDVAELADVQSDPAAPPSEVAPAELLADAPPQAFTPPPAASLPPPELGRGPPRWGLIAFGATTTVTFGVAAGVTWQVSRGWLEEGERAPYVALRPVNHASIALAGLGASVTALGIALRRAPEPTPLTLAPWVSAQDGVVMVGASYVPGR